MGQKLALVYLSKMRRYSIIYGKSCELQVLFQPNESKCILLHSCRRKKGREEQRRGLCRPLSGMQVFVACRNDRMRRGNRGGCWSLLTIRQMTICAAAN